MADRRIQPERLQGSTALKPVASPSETFVPIRGGGERSGLRDLVESLQSVAPRLERFGVSMAEDAAKEDAKNAMVAAQQLTEAANWKQAVEQGLVDPGASPVFRRVWAETRGGIDATNATAEWEREMLMPDSPLLNTENPADVQKWFAEKRSAFLNGKDRDFAIGASKALSQAEGRLLEKHTRIWTDRRFNEAKDDLGRLMVDTIREGFAAGQTDEQIMRAVTERSIPHQFAGLPRADVNQVVAQAITSYAKRVGETDTVLAHRILDLAYADRPDLAKAGGTVPGVGKVPAIGAFIEDARRSIDAGAWTREQRAQLLQQRQREEQTRAFYERVAPMLASGQGLNSAQLIELFKLNPSEARATISSQQAMADAGRTQALRAAEDEITDRLAKGQPVDMEWILQRFGGMRNSGDMVSAAARVLKTVETAEISAVESRYLPYVYATLMEAPSALDAMGMIATSGITVDGKQVRLSDQTVRRLSREAMDIQRSRDSVTTSIWQSVKPSLRDPTIPSAMPQNGRYETQASFAFQREVSVFIDDYTRKNGTKPPADVVRREAQAIGNEVANWVRWYQQSGRNAETFEAEQFVRGQFTKPVDTQQPQQQQPQQQAAPQALPEFPMQFVQTERSFMGKVLGENSAAARNMIPKPYLPKEGRNEDGIGTRRILPNDQQITDLATVIVNAPESADAIIRAFDAEFGTNAAYHYYTRWRAQQKNR